MFVLTQSEVNIMIKEMIENKDVRNKYRDRIDVVDEVKELIHPAGLKIFTRDEIAEYFGTSSSTIKRVIGVHGEELRVLMIVKKMKQLIVKSIIQLLTI